MVEELLASVTAPLLQRSFTTELTENYELREFLKTLSSIEQKGVELGKLKTYRLI